MILIHWIGNKLVRFDEKRDLELSRENVKFDGFEWRKNDFQLKIR